MPALLRFAPSLTRVLPRQMTVQPGWNVNDGPMPTNASCYGEECVQQSARDHSDCQNAHIADAVRPPSPEPIPSSAAKQGRR